MTFAEAVQLVNKKHMDERQNKENLKTTVAYNDAVLQCPATMAIAHCYVAIEFSKSGHK